MKIDIIALKEFLDATGCGLYFVREPFIVAGHTAQINLIEDATLMKWVEEYNNGRDEKADALPSQEKE